MILAPPYTMSPVWWAVIAIVVVACALGAIAAWVFLSPPRPHEFERLRQQQQEEDDR